MNGDKIISKTARRIIFYTVFIVLAILVRYASTFPAETTFTSPLSIFEPQNKVSILVVGDIMLDRNVRARINKVGFDTFFAGVKNLISDADIAVANLEGPFTTFRSVTDRQEFTFTFDPALAPRLADLGFDILGLANNHTLNFGRQGIDMTQQYIRDAGMFYYGEPNNKEELSVVIEKNGIKVGFVGFHEFTYINFDKVLAEIDKLRPEVDILIVSPHWGVEYQKAPTKNMQKWAHEFIDHGADAVIGAHPHIVGDTEEYNDKKIFYSLGNFVFDQYFSEETMNGLAVVMEVEKNKKIKYTTVNIRIDREGPRAY